MPVSRLNSMSMPRFGGHYGIMDELLGSGGEDKYNHVMTGGGRIEITHAGAGILQGYIREHPEKAHPLMLRLIELRIPQVRINQIFEVPPPPPKPTLKDKKAQDALAVFDKEDGEIRRILASGRMPTYYEVRAARKRVALETHGDYNGTHVDNGGRLGPVMEAWNTLSPLLQKD